MDALIQQGDLTLDEHGRVTMGRRRDYSVQESAGDRSRRVYRLGEMGSPSGVPELIAALEDLNGNVRRLAASALGKIGDARAVLPLLALLAQEQRPSQTGEIDGACLAASGLGGPLAYARGSESVVTAS